MQISDPFIDINGPLNRLPATFKLVAAILLILVAAALPRTCWPASATLLAFVVAVLFASRLPVRTVVTRLLVLEPFVVVAAALSLMQPHGGSVFSSLLLKSTTGLLTMILMVASTRFPDLLRVLRRFRLPSLLVTTIALTYRYLFLLLFEANRMSRARAARELTRRRWCLWHLNATVIGHLFLRTSRRADRVLAAMCSRGWQV